MRKQHIFLKPLLYSKPRQISFKKFGFGPWHAGGKLFPMKKKKNREGIQGRYYDVKKKNVFPNSMEK